MTRSVSGSMPPSTRAPVAGSRAAWPEQNRRPSLTMPWLYGPIAAGAPVVETARAGHDRSSFLRVADDGGGRRRTVRRRRVRASVPSRDGGPDGIGGGRRLRLGRIERPQGRTGAGQPDRPAEETAQRTLERHEGRDDERGRRQQVVGRRQHARAGDEVRGGQPGTQLLGEVGRRHADGAVALVPDGVEGGEDVRRRDGDDRRDQQDPGRAVETVAAARRSHRDPRRGPDRRRGRTARPSRGGRRRHGASSSSSSAPHASRAPSRRRPRPTSRRRARRRPGSASRGGPRGPARDRDRPGRPPPTATRAAAIARKTRLSAGGPASRPLTWSVSCVPADRARG